MLVLPTIIFIPMKFTKSLAVKSTDYAIDESYTCSYYISYSYVCDIPHAFGFQKTGESRITMLGNKTNVKEIGSPVELICIF